MIVFATSQIPGQDNHDLWIDPDGDRITIAGDFGISISLNRGKTWVKKNLPIAQMYHVTTDTRIPYNVFGNKQDGPSYGGPSNSLSIRARAFRARPGMRWAEANPALPRPTRRIPNIIWSSASGAGSVGGIVVRFDQRTRRTRDVEIWPETTTGASAAEVKYRFQWTFPLEISPFRPQQASMRAASSSTSLRMAANRGMKYQSRSDA